MTTISQVGLKRRFIASALPVKSVTAKLTAAKLKNSAPAAAPAPLLTSDVIATQSFTPTIKALAIQGGQIATPIPTDTGNTNTDALLNGGTNYWWYNKTKDGGKTFTLSYSMLGPKLATTASATDRNGYKPMTAAQKGAVSKALAYISSIINVKFVSVASGNGDLNFGTNAQGGVSAGYANFPNASGGHNSYVMLANDQATNNSPVAGNYGWQTLVHEIGHALGLKHPGDYNAGGGGGVPPFLPENTDNQRNTIMSYQAPSDAKIYNYKITVSKKGASLAGTISNVGVYGFMQYDLDALQYLYGANTKANGAGQVTSFSNAWKGLQTLWLPVANSKIDASKVTYNNIIDLRDGAFSSIAIQPSTPTDIAEAVQKYNTKWADVYAGNNTYFGFNNVGLAKGSKVTNVAGGAGVDVIYANSLSSLTIDGGKGNDTVYLGGASTEWTVKGKAGNQVFTNSVTMQKVNLKNVEAIKYYDMNDTDVSHSSVDLTA